jgi:uncharacterized protein
MSDNIDYSSILAETRFIDSHMHLGLHRRYHYIDYTDDEVIDVERRFNVKKCLCSHIMGLLANDLDEQMRQINNLYKRFGDYIYWYMIYNPNISSKSLNIIKNNMNKINFAGIKIHPVAHSCNLDDEKYYPLWEFSIENNVVILSHTWSPYTENPDQFRSNPLLLDNVLKKYKELKIIAGHGGGKIPFYDKVIKLLEKYPNLYVDYSGDTLYPQVLRKAIDSIGSKRVLFGTDMPVIDIRYHIINLFKADLSKEERDNIAYYNSTALFNLKDE